MGGLTKFFNIFKGTNKGEQQFKLTDESVLTLHRMDLFSHKILVENNLIENISVFENFEKLGGTLSECSIKTVELSRETPLAPREEQKIYCKYKDITIGVEVKNYSLESIPLYKCDVVNIWIPNSDKVYFPKGIKVTDSLDTLIEKWGAPSNIRDEKWYVYHEYTNRTEKYVDCPTGNYYNVLIKDNKIDAISYNLGKLPSKNQDTIIVKFDYEKGTITSKVKIDFENCYNINEGVNMYRTVYTVAGIVYVVTFDLHFSLHDLTRFRENIKTNEEFIIKVFSDEEANYEFNTYDMIFKDGIVRGYGFTTDDEDCNGNICYWCDIYYTMGDYFWCGNVEMYAINKSDSITYAAKDKLKTLVRNMVSNTEILIDNK